MGRIFQTILAAVLTFLLATAMAFGGIIQTSPDDFAVLAGGRLSVDRGAGIDGLVGAVGNAWLDRDVRVGGGVYTAGTFGGGRDLTVGGRVVAGGGVWLDRGSTVGSIDGGRSVGLSRGVTAAGYVAADRRVTIDRDAVVGGEVSYGSGYWISGRATVGGEVGRGLRDVDVWRTTLEDAPGDWAALPGATYYRRGADVSLVPDTYGGLNVDRDGTVRLAAGTYDVGSVWLGSGTRLVADTGAGDVVLNVGGSLSTGGDVRFEDTGPGNLIVRVEDAVYLGRGTQAEGSLSSFGSFDVDADSSITGRLYSSGNMWLGRGTEVNAAVPPPVPEPATVLLIGGGASLLLFPRRRRRVGPMA